MILKMLLVLKSNLRNSNITQPCSALYLGKECVVETRAEKLVEWSIEKKLISNHFDS